MHFLHHFAFRSATYTWRVVSSLAKPRRSIRTWQGLALALALVATMSALACQSAAPLPSLGGGSASGDKHVGGSEGCVDVDQDGFGASCVAGSDCDDSDDSITDECYRCLTPQEGCECDSGGAIAVCGKRVSQIGDYVSCVEGERICVAGIWGPCSIEGGDVYTVSASRTHFQGQGTGGCDDLCDPNCQGLESPPEADDDVVTDEDGAITLIPPGNVSTGPEQCEGATAKADPIEVGMVFVIDKSGSMGRNDGTSSSRWNKFTPALTNFLNSPSTGDLNVGMEFFPDYSGTSSCSADTYKALIAPIGKLSTQRVTLINTLNAQRPSGGTPLLAATRGGLEALEVWIDAAPNRRGAVILVTDGEPTGCRLGTTTHKDLVTEVVAQYYGKGIQTFAMGLEGADALDYLHSIGKAGSGDTRDAFIVSATGANAAAEMEAALMEIRASFLSCEYSVPPVDTGVIDPNATTLDLTANGQTRTLGMVTTLADCANTDGFYFDAASYQMVLCPRSCSFAQSDVEAEAEISFSCKSSCTSGTERASPGPIDLFLMVDRSGSMGWLSRWKPWKAVRSAISNFARTSVDDGLGLGISYFPPASTCVQPRGTKRSNDVTKAMTAFRYDEERRRHTDKWRDEAIRTVECAMVAGKTNRTYFYRSDSTCDAEDYVDAGFGTVPIAPLDSAQADLIDRSVYSVWPDGRTPMQPALEGAISAALAQEQQSGKQAAVILATDGEPTQCEGSDPVGEVAATATAGRDEGIETFVIGIGDVADLDRIAEAGSGNKAFIVAGGDQSAFTAKLQEIRELVQACNLEVPAPPEGYFDLQTTELIITNAAGVPTLIPRVTSNAGCGAAPSWYYDDNADPTMINLCPSACDFAREAQGRTDVLYQCLVGVEEAPVIFTYDSNDLCPAGHTPVWTDWSWSTETPGDSRIEFEVATGDSLTALSGFYPIQFTQDRFVGEAVCASAGNACVGLDSDTMLGGPLNGFPHDAFITTTLEAHGLFSSERFLQVRATLYSDDADVPKLMDYEQRVTCIPSH